MRERGQIFSCASSYHKLTALILSHRFTWEGGVSKFDRRMSFKETLSCRIQLWLSLHEVLAFSLHHQDISPNPHLFCLSTSLVTMGRTMLTSHSLCNCIISEQVLFLATAQKQGVIQVCTSAQRGCVCVCVSKSVCVWVVWACLCLLQCKIVKECERNSAGTQGQPATLVEGECFTC